MLQQRQELYLEKVLDQQAIVHFTLQTYTIVNIHSYKYVDYKTSKHLLSLYSHIYDFQWVYIAIIQCA